MRNKLLAGFRQGVFDRRKKTGARFGSPGYGVNTAGIVVYQNKLRQGLYDGTAAEFILLMPYNFKTGD